MTERAGVYLHIPFCAARCHYCNFATGAYEAEIAERYVQAIRSEIRLAGTSPRQASRYSQMSDVDTVYFGGGTPTTLSVEQIASILETCHTTFNVSETAEITVEANPGSISREYLLALRRAGVNRLSFGVQSFDDRELSMIGRIHDSGEARLAIRLAREAGFDNISLDLIAGLPGQIMDTWQSNLECAFELTPDHLSVYLLELYKDAPLIHRIERGEVRPIDEDVAIASYFALVDEAERRGYAHYELSNWARPGRESRHNMKYWNGASYWAFGVSAAGYDVSSRWSNTRNINDYLKRLESGDSAVAETIELSDEDRQSEALFLQLRLKEGVDLAHHEARFGVDVLSRYRVDLERLSEAGLIELSEGTLRISRAGTVLANEVFAVFV
ncbi:MAG: radical SAM family heme chaperone HemW [Acidobacteriota bacterium]